MTQWANNVIELIDAPRGLVPTSQLRSYARYWSSEYLEPQLRSRTDDSWSGLFGLFTGLLWLSRFKFGAFFFGARAYKFYNLVCLGCAWRIYDRKYGG